MSHLPAGRAPVVQRQLDRYMALVRQWAPRVNLVAIPDLSVFMERHVAPALGLVSIIKSLPHARLLDVGSGAGLPGIPLAIALPGSTVVLVESRRRRANFLKHAVRTLGLVNTSVVCTRVEEWEAPAPFDFVISRAVTGLGTLASLTSHCLSPAGFLIVTTGPDSNRRTRGMRSFVKVLCNSQQPAQALIAHPIRAS